MSSPLLSAGEEEECQSNVTLLASSASVENVAFKERNYMGLSGCSSEDRAVESNVSDKNKRSLNLKATELRLGLPGSQSPERDPEPRLSSTQLDEKHFFPLYPSCDGHHTSQKAVVSSGNKRGFKDAMDGFSEGKFVANLEVNIMLSPRPSPNLGLKTSSVLNNIGTQPAKAKDVAPAKNHNGSANNNSSAPAPKVQVVGWPPIRSFRKNSLVSTSKNTDDVDGKSGPGPLFVKVSMDGAPYLRKVDLKNYCAYQELSSSLEKMFSCFTIGQYGSHGALGKEMMSESKLQDMLHGSEYVLTYEDKDGDWMLVGDVPWGMFINTCKRLRIMKSSDAIGLAPRAMEKCRNRN